jgi:hypothetical protein
LTAQAGFLILAIVNDSAPVCPTEIEMPFYLSHPVDFRRHNDETKRVWDAYRARRPYRVPVTLSGSISNLFCNPAINDTGYTFRDFFERPEAQVKAQLAYRKWWRYNLVYDQEMGPPEKGWSISVDFQNSYEAGWFGCILVYPDGAVPDALPMLQERKERLYELEPPDPLRGNLYARVMDFFEFMQDRCPSMEFDGRPVIPPSSIPGEGTDGPFTVACKLRGLTEMCLDMYEDRAYFHDLMKYVTANTIKRIRAIKEWRWARKPESKDRGKYQVADWGFADDAIAMLSTEQYREFVLPYHQELRAAFSDGGRISMHLCGDATHLYSFMRDNLNAYSFDTGFPVDFGALRRNLGPEVQIFGGPSIMALKDGTPASVRAEVRRICKSGITEGGRFVLREGNNMAPCTPVENVEAMYDAAKEYGQYDSPR